MENENVVTTEENTTLETPQDCYVKHSEFTILKEEVEDIRDNHLKTILATIKGLATKEEVREAVGHFRWYIIAGAGIIGIVLAILQVFG